MPDQPQQPGAAEDDKELARNRTTFLLMVGGAISLLIPLVAVGYMHYRDMKALGPTGAGGTAVFEHRADDPSSAALTPAATPAPDGPGGNRLAQVPNLAPRDNSPAPLQPNMGSQQGGSLSFIRASSDYTGQQPAQQQAAAPAQAAPQPPPQQAPAPAPEPQAQASVANLQQKKPAKPAYKPFNVPHLKPSGFGGSQPQQMAGAPGQQGGPGGLPGGGNPAAAMAAMQQMGGGQGGAGGMPNMGAMMQQMGGAQGGQGGMPNIGAMMQGMGGAQGAQGGAGGMPNMGAMMQQMQQQQGQQH